MDYIGFAYALIIAVGGIIGFIKAGSAVSLAMGLSFGAVAAYGALLLGRDARNFWLLLLCSGLLGCIMGYRALNSGKFVPAGIVALLSVLMVIRLAPRLM